jgi:hypothetical protein
MNKENSNILIEKYSYMFSERSKSLESLNKITKLQNELNDAVIEKDEVKIAQIKEDMKEVRPFYAIAFGFECDDGWFNLLDNLMAKIQEIDKDRITVIHQIKEKKGSLRFYTGGSTNEIYELIDEAEEQSYNICEVCGNQAKLCTTENWLKVVCKSHRQIETWTGMKQNYIPIIEFDKNDEVILDDKIVKIISMEFNEEKDTWICNLDNGESIIQENLKRIPYNKFIKKYVVKFRTKLYKILSFSYDIKEGWIYNIVQKNSSRTRKHKYVVKEEELKYVR